MKKILVFSVLSVLIAFNAFAYTPQEVDERLRTAISNTMAARGLKVQTEIERLADMKEPAGFYFYRVTVKDPERKMENTQHLFFNGNTIAPDFLNAKTNASLARDILFDTNITEIDVTNLTPLYGKKGAKNVIVKITDFECPYCRQADAYLESKIKNKDVVVYIAHLPLQIHKNAVTLARVFEAGSLMGKNFGHEIFSTPELSAKTEAEILEIFAKKSGNKDRFIQYYNSQQVADKLANSALLTESLGVSATPVMFINGKKVDGFDAQLIDRGIAEFK